MCGKTFKVGIVQIGPEYSTLMKSLSEDPSVQLYTIPSPGGFPRTFSLRSSLYYEITSCRLVRHVQRLDLDLLHCPFEIVPSYFWLANGINKVITLNGAAPFVVGKEMLPPHAFSLQRKLFRATIRLFKARVAKFVTLSQWSKEVLAQAYSIPRNRIDVIYPGVNTEFFRPASRQEIDDLLAQLHIRPPYILWASSYRPLKNVETLVKAFGTAADFLASKGRQLSLVIAGAKEGTYHSKVKNAVKGNCSSDKIHFLGPLSEELPALYSGAIATMVVSLTETFGLPIIESMACGTPVIAAHVDGIPEAGGDAALYVDDPLDVDAISHAIVSVVSDAKLRRNLADRGTRRVRRSFSLASFKQRILKFYKKILWMNEQEAYH